MKIGLTEIIDAKKGTTQISKIMRGTVLIWEKVISAALAINILTPTEGQEITGDVNITFELLGSTGINILTPTEGQEITGDVNITFESI